MNIALALAIRNARLGIAISQLAMGHWTPEFYKERCQVYEDEFKRALLP